MGNNGDNQFSPQQISGLQEWHKAESGVYQDGAVQLTANDKEYLSIASNSTLQTGDIDFSFCGWVYLDTVSSAMTVCSKAALSSNREYDFYITSTGKLRLTVWDGSTTQVADVASTASLSSATWYMVTGYYDSVNNLVGVKINDNAFETSATTGNCAVSTASFAVGSNPDSGTRNYMNGRIDSLLFYKKILSSAEITWLYNSGSGRMISDLYESSALSGITTSLISGWSFNESTGVRYDYVGTNHLTETFGGMITPSVNNGGFETLGGGGADVFGTWTESPTGGATITADVTSYAGTYACKFNAVAGTGQVYQNIGFLTGKTYYAECYARRTTSGGSEYVALRIGGASSGTAGAGISFALTTTYTKYVATYRNTGNSFMYVDGGSGDILVDNITVQAAEILGTSGIAKGTAKDQNFCASFPAPASTSNYLSASDNASLDFTSSFTIAGWVNFDSLTQTGDALIVQKNSAQYRLLGIGYAGGGTTQLYFDVNSSGAITRPISLSDWVFVVAEWNASTLKTSLTVNLGTAATGSSTQPAVSATSLAVGQRMYGRLESLGMWSRVLTTAEQTYLFNLGRGRKYAELGLSGTDGSDLLTNCESFWNLDEASGTRVDSRGVNNLFVNGTVNQGQGVNYQEGIVSRWLDLSGNNRHLNQLTNSKRPGYRISQVNGKPAIIFDGSDDSMKTSAYTLNQPTTVILVFNQITWTNGDTIFDGITGNLGNIFQNSLSPRLTVYAGLSAANNDNMTVNTYAFAIVEFNGASSSLQINNTTKTTGNAGTANMGGFTIGDYGNGGFASNIGVAEIIIYNKILSASEITLLKKYCNTYGLGL